jgi:hypothetical protein
MNNPIIKSSLTKIVKIASASTYQTFYAPLLDFPVIRKESATTINSTP